MPRNIPLIIEYAAFFRFNLLFNHLQYKHCIFIYYYCFCCIRNYDGIISSATKTKIAHIYNAIFLLSALITNIISNGFYLSTVFPVFFMAVLLFVARYINVPYNQKTKTRTRSLERGDTVYQSFKDTPIKYILHLYKKANTFFWYTRKLYCTTSYIWNVVSCFNHFLLVLLTKKDLT